MARIDEGGQATAVPLSLHRVGADEGAESGATESGAETLRVPTAESYLLLIDTAAQACSAAVAKGERILAELSLCTGHTHAASLTGCIRSVLDRTDISPADLGGLVCTVGPGSFTGLRIGLATAKGMALPFGLPVLPVSTLAALAEPWLALKQPVAALLDARSGRLFAAIYQQNEAGRVETLLPPCQIHCSDLLADLPENLLAVGDGAPVLAAYLSADGRGEREAAAGVEKEAAAGGPFPAVALTQLPDPRVRPAGILGAARRLWQEAGDTAFQPAARVKIDYLALSQAERLSGIKVTE